MKHLIEQPARVRTTVDLPRELLDRSREVVDRGLAKNQNTLFTAALADYLDQHGRAHRADEIPPAEFWSAAATHATADDQAALGDAADALGLLSHAAVQGGRFA